MIYAHWKDTESGAETGTRIVQGSDESDRLTIWKTIIFTMQAAQQSTGKHVARQIPGACSRIKTVH